MFKTDDLSTNIKNLEKLTINTSLLLTKDIHFSQASVSATFSDGTLVASLIKKLVQGEVNADDVDCIRVVTFQRKWVTLDNRRLRAFKDAMIDKIQVVICDLKDPKIHREFHSKRTNKSSDSGGSVRTFQIGGSTQHFDDGTFVFVKKILNLTFEQLAQPLVALHIRQPLPEKFYSSVEYYSGFLDLIIEEARASLQAGIETSISSENAIFNLTLQEYKIAKKPENPTTIIFTKLFEEKRNIKAYDAFLLESNLEQPSVQLLALASYAPSEDSNRIVFKVVVGQDLYNRGITAFKAENKWTAKPIGSVVTHLRMYDVCTACPEVLWMSKLLSGQLQSERKNIESYPIVQGYFPNLNKPQVDAITQFLQLDQGLQLVQGPPGTGKTTMVVSLLKLLTEQGRVLVCAPSNKAVQVIAERFVLQFPEISAVLVGVEDKLPENNASLRQIFIHTWGDLKLEMLASIQRKLWELLPNNVFVGTEGEVTKKIEIAAWQIKKIEKELTDMFVDFAKYGINMQSECTIDIFKQGIAHYLELITQELYDVKEIIELLSNLTTHLSQLTMILNKKMIDDSIKGLEGELLNNSAIIFATLSVSGRKLLKEMGAVRALVVDEAGQALEAETLIPLVSKPRKCLLIGDTNQLPATVISTEATRLKFDRSLMWRLLEDCKQDYNMLTMQYRMHPEIRYWPAKQYYQDRLQDSVEIASLSRVLPSLSNAPIFIAPYAFINVEGKEASAGYSFTNPNEVNSILNLIQYLKNQLHLNVASQVGIITFYKGQVGLINQRLRRNFLGVKVNTVDGFQGDENDVIIISCVRANLSGNIGFVNDFRRLNVALTRSKHSLIIVGNANTLEKSHGDLSLLIQNARDRQCFFNYGEVSGQLISRQQLPAFNIHKTKICSFDQKKAGSCRFGAKCRDKHGINSLKK